MSPSGWVTGRCEVSASKITSVMPARCVRSRPAPYSGSSLASSRSGVRPPRSEPDLVGEAGFPRLPPPLVSLPSRAGDQSKRQRCLASGPAERVAPRAADRFNLSIPRRGGGGRAAARHFLRPSTQGTRRGGGSQHNSGIFFLSSKVDTSRGPRLAHPVPIEADTALVLQPK